ncbi:TetR/AcrR family transcriptional regulator [Lactovum odontotermitis]
MSTDTRRQRSKEKLKNAMATLLQEKPFEQITTTELVKEAGISRSSFYTHYQDKYDMIEYYQQILFNTIQYVFEKNRTNLRDTLYETYDFLDNNEIYAALLSENGSKEIHEFILQKLVKLIEDTIFTSIGPSHQLSRLEETYGKVYYANAVFGMTQAWIRRKRRERPSVMADLFVSLVGFEAID